MVPWRVLKVMEVCHSSVIGPLDKGYQVLTSLGMAQHVGAHLPKQAKGCPSHFSYEPKYFWEAITKTPSSKTLRLPLLLSKFFLIMTERGSDGEGKAPSYLSFLFSTTSDLQAEQS